MSRHQTQNSNQKKKKSFMITFSRQSNRINKKNTNIIIYIYL
jgi:hypothetical protein